MKHICSKNIDQNHHIRTINIRARQIYTYFARSFETESDIAAVSHRLPALRTQTFLTVKKDRGLFLERAFAL